MSHNNRENVREIKYSQAIREAIDQCLDGDSSVYLMGLGVPDPKGVFGTTLGLHEKHGADRVMDMPTSENGMTGIAIGSALVGMRPIMVHQRVDFAILAMEQIVNQAAKWHYMFGGKMSVPLVIRLIVGRGWGQGPQHSQSLQSWFAHVPGLRVIMPTTPYDMKGLMVSSIEDNNPVICIEHRWLYNITGYVPEETYRVPLGKARVMKEGEDLTIVAMSHMSLEALRAAELLEREGVSIEVIDLRSLRPLDMPTILESVRKTGHLLVADTSWKTGGFAGEIVSRVTEEAFGSLKAAPRRIALPDYPAPTSPSLANSFYPGTVDIIESIRKVLGSEKDLPVLAIETPEYLDVPDPSFVGPF
jgi:pyruvate/2-oxoglutarate/acetoin dehydrogenase E1 component